MSSNFDIPRGIPEAVNVEGIPLDLIAIGFLAVALFLFGLTGGRRFSIAFLLSLFLAEGVVSVLPSFRTFLLRFGTKLPAHTPAVVFLFAMALATWLLAGSAATAIFRFSGKGVRALWQVVFATVLSVGLFVVLFFPLLPTGALRPSSALNAFVLSDPFPFLWVLGAFVFFALVRGNED